MKTALLITSILPATAYIILIVTLFVKMNKAADKYSRICRSIRSSFAEEPEKERHHKTISACYRKTSGNILLRYGALSIFCLLLTILCGMLIMIQNL